MPPKESGEGRKRTPSKRASRAQTPAGRKAAETAAAANAKAEAAVKAEAAAKCWSHCRWPLGVFFAILLIAVAAYFAGALAPSEPTGVRAQSPCPCARAAYDAPTSDAQRRLAGALFSRRGAAISGVHVRTSSVPDVTAALGFLPGCGKVVHLAAAPADLEALHKALAAPLRRSKCVAWVVEEAALAAVASPLKELLEDNSLRGVPVVPHGSRGLLVLVSGKSREELKESMPHRVVHMFASIAAA